MTERVQSAAEVLLSGTPVFVLEARVTPGKTTRIRVIVDGDTGVTIDACAQISRELNQQMEGLGITGDYNLEVTTPGVDQPLRIHRQFPKHVGRTLRVVLKDGKEIKGKLLEVGPESIRLAVEKASTKKKTEEVAEQEISLGDMEKALVMISFK